MHRRRLEVEVKFSDENAILTAATAYLADHRAVEKSNSELKKEFEGRTHAALYGSLANGFALCLAMNDPANASAVAQFLRKRDVPAAKGKVNPFYPLVRALYGREEPGVLNAKWQPNASATKYANVFRWADKKGIKPDKFQEWLTGFNDPEFGGGITGVEKRDRKENGYNDPDQEVALQQDIKLVSEQPPLGTIDVSGGGIADKKAKYICLWGKLKKDGKFVAVGELPNMTSRVEAHLRKIAPEEAKVIREAEKRIARKAARSSASTQSSAHSREQSLAVSA